MQDATQLSLGQEFSGYTSAIDHGIERIKNALKSCYELAIGGTAVGTGINSFEGYAEAAANEISSITSLPFKTAQNKFETLLSPKTTLLLSVVRFPEGEVALPALNPKSVLLLPVVRL